MKKQYLFSFLFLPLLFGLFRTTNKTSITSQSSVLGITSTDWPQVAHDAAHTGLSSETLGTNFQVKWTHTFAPERIFPQVQPIIVAGKVFVGTENGNLYAFDAINGSQLWKYQINAPILSSVASDGNSIFVSSMDGAIYAINFSAQLVWKTYVYMGAATPNPPRLGFSASPIVADGKVIVGGRDGYLYALNPATGSVVWAYNTTAPILQPAAWDNGKAYVASMDMYVRAVTTSNGNFAWISAKINGLSLKDYWPVATQGKIIIIPWGQRQRDPGIPPSTPFIYGLSSTWLATYGPTVAAGNLSQVADAVNAQNQVMSNYQSNPANFTPVINILDEATGGRAFDIPHFDIQILHGAMSPPCVDKNNLITIPVMFGSSGWGRTDLTQKRYVDVLYDGSGAGFGNSDENMNVSCSQNLIFGTHSKDVDGTANYSGAFNLTTRKWTKLAGGKRSMLMSNNNQAAGGSPVSISNGMVFHISMHELIARSTN